jgi:hypothetical protein
VEVVDPKFFKNGRTKVVFNDFWHLVSTQTQLIFTYFKNDSFYVSPKYIDCNGQYSSYSVNIEFFIWVISFFHTGRIRNTPEETNIDQKGQILDWMTWMKNSKQCLKFQNSQNVDEIEQVWDQIWIHKPKIYLNPLWFMVYEEIKWLPREFWVNKIWNYLCLLENFDYKRLFLTSFGLLVLHLRISVLFVQNLNFKIWTGYTGYTVGQWTLVCFFYVYSFAIVNFESQLSIQ